MNNSNSNLRVCHFTSAHNSTDTRIFVKECVGLANAGYDVYLVARGESRDERGVHVIGVGNGSENRIKRATTFARTVYKAAVKLDCDVYQFHDPELHRFALKLKKQGKTVIFDSHEDVPKQIMDKYWIPKYLRGIISLVFRQFERFSIKKYDAVVTATESIKKSLCDYAKKTVVINNYPKLEDVKLTKTPFADRPLRIGYAGSLDDNRGRQAVVKAMGAIDAEFYLAGNEKINSAKFVNCGLLNRDGVNELYEKSRLGMVLYKPLANHIAAQPIKLFEYMAAGLPVVTSNFPLWKEIVEENNCGICVNPEDVSQIAEACNKILNNPVLAEQMGKNGRKVVIEKYDWVNEERRLIELYSLLSKRLRKQLIR